MSERVYDERGNVRPEGFPDARPMTYEERVLVAVETDSTSEAVAEAVETAAPRKSNKK